MVQPISDIATPGSKQHHVLWVGFLDFPNAECVFVVHTSSSKICSRHHVRRCLGCLEETAARSDNRDLGVSPDDLHCHCRLSLQAIERDHNTKR